MDIVNNQASDKPIDFSAFILSLSTTALLQLGVIENPYTKKREKDVAMAKGTIDVLGLIKEKTKGNLTKEEDALLEGILAELRMTYYKMNVEQGAKTNEKS
ncbi:MAG TPA: DUF1844 domain-containing protein, partial [Thermodesulfobacteriota bacterium]|nr:DUF1844 domain-containing protein [Thermodesulfobacteriota bacterium]